MEEVYTCICGCQIWVVSSGHIECGRCRHKISTDEIVSDDGLIGAQEFNAHIHAVESMKKGVESE